jgi:hypothetical protein
MPEANVRVSTQGDHHEGELQIDTKTKTIQAGVLYNFSNNSEAQLNIANGRLGGSFRHTGDTHALTLELDRNGSFSGTYRETRGEQFELEISAGKAKVVKGRLPLSGKLSLKGDHHSLDLQVDDKGTVSGRIKSKITRDATFDLSVDKGLVSGAVTHEGQNHKTRLELSSKGWKGGVDLKKGSKSLSIEVTGGEDLRLSSAQVKAAIEF